MARTYPRFLYSDPQDTKSAGPFIVHTLPPQLIAKVHFNPEGFHQLELLSVFATLPGEEVDDVISAMHNWLTARRMKEAHLAPDFYERMTEISRQLTSSRFFESLSISVVHRPVMGASIRVGKAGQDVEITLANEDTFESAVIKLQDEYRRIYGRLPDWPPLN